MSLSVCIDVCEGFFPFSRYTGGVTTTKIKMKGSQICTVVLEKMISGDQDLILKYLVIFAMLKETYDLLGLVNNDANKKKWWGNGG